MTGEGPIQVMPQIVGIRQTLPMAGTRETSPVVGTRQTPPTSGSRRTSPIAGTRPATFQRYGVINSSSAMIILNNRQRHKGSSRLRPSTAVCPPHNRFVAVDPSRHFRDHTIHSCDIAKEDLTRMKGHKLMPLAKRPFKLFENRSYSWKETSEILHTARSSVNPRRHRMCQPISVLESSDKRSTVDLYARNPYTTRPNLVRYDSTLSTSSKLGPLDACSEDHTSRRLQEVTSWNNEAKRELNPLQIATPWFMQRNVEIARKVYLPPSQGKGTVRKERTKSNDLSKNNMNPSGKTKLHVPSNKPRR